LIIIIIVVVILIVKFVVNKSDPTPKAAKRFELSSGIAARSIATSPQIERRLAAPGLEWDGEKLAPVVERSKATREIKFLA